jgi:hypothetical protein
MKVNLLQGTYTPTLTPMPGVHKALQLTVNPLRGLSAAELGRYCDTRSQFVLLNVNRM